MSNAKNQGRLTLHREAVRVLRVSSGVLTGKPKRGPAPPDSMTECYSIFGNGCVSYDPGCPIMTSHF